MSATRRAISVNDSRECGVSTHYSIRVPARHHRGAECPLPQLAARKNLAFGTLENTIRLFFGLGWTVPRSCRITPTEYNDKYLGAIPTARPFCSIGLKQSTMLNGHKEKLVARIGQATQRFLLVGAPKAAIVS